MHNPLLWLGLSLFLVAVCLVAVLLVAIPVIQELSRTARSAEKLLDMLSRELPPTLQSLRSTGDDLSQLSGQVNEGVRSASQVVTQVDQGLETVRSQAENVKRGSISLLAGMRAAWQHWRDPDADLYYEDPTIYDDFESYGNTEGEPVGGYQAVTNGYRPSTDTQAPANMNSSAASDQKDVPATSEPEPKELEPKSGELSSSPAPATQRQAVEEQS